MGLGHFFPVETGPRLLLTVKVSNPGHLLERSLRVLPLTFSALFGGEQPESTSWAEVCTDNCEH